MVLEDCPSSPGNVTISPPDRQSPLQRIVFQCLDEILEIRSHFLVPRRNNARNPNNHSRFRKPCPSSFFPLAIRSVTSCTKLMRAKRPLARLCLSRGDARRHRHVPYAAYYSISSIQLVGSSLLTLALLVAANDQFLPSYDEMGIQSQSQLERGEARVCSAAREQGFRKRLH